MSITSPALATVPPHISQMIGARCEYTHARPYGYSPIVATGTITDYEVKKNGDVRFFVQPDLGHLCPKWREEDDLIRYLYQSSESAKAAA